jgi:Tfp pilus assembly protein PilF
MNNIHRVLPLLCIVPLLQSCESTPPKQAWTMQPVLRVHNSDESPSGYYQLGRYYQGQNRLDKAIPAFQKALTLDSHYAEAHNALGALYAAQGNYDLAIAEFQSALAAAPTTAHFQNNLGYAYYLQGRYTEAATIFEKAATLNPADAKIANNLGLTLAKLGQPRQAQQAFMLAATPHAASGLAAPGSTTDAVTKTLESSAMPLSLPKDQGAITPAVTAPLDSAPPPITPPLGTTTETDRATEQLAMELVKSSPNRYELRRKEDTTAAALTLQPAAKAPLPNALPHFEVANGNGITGMARRVSHALVNRGFPSARLTNQKPFQQSVTLVEYRQGFATEAKQLSASLPAKPMIKEKNDLRGSTDIRLVLGKDVMYNVALVTPAQNEDAIRLALE